jgi:DNA-directed RNA polymerase subunit N (RpoN/RPB10)
MPYEYMPWLQWNTTYSNTASTTIWTDWNTTHDTLWTGTGGNSTTLSNQVWINWNATTTSTLLIPAMNLATGAPAYIETPERRAARESANAVWREEEKVRKASREEAKRKATVLLLDHLTDEQRAEFQRNQTFTVMDKYGQRRYRVRRAIAGHVDEISAEGKVLRNFCIHPSENVPEEDNMLIAKLMIEHDVDEFWRIANIQDRTNGRHYGRDQVPEPAIAV